MGCKLALFIAAIGTFGLMTGSSKAGSVSVDGVIGSEWNGVSAITINHDDNADVGNFSSPGSTTKGADYTVQVRDDGSYYYVALHATGHLSSLAGDFANLYFDTDPTALPGSPSHGSDVAFEVTNNNYFIPGVTGSFDATPYLDYAVNSSTHTIELAIKNSFFTSGPKAGPAYPNGYPVATDDVVLRLSQSFGYSVAGGNSTTLGVDSARLGSASITPVPLPKAAFTGLLVLAGPCVIAAARKRRQSKLA